MRTQKQFEGAEAELTQLFTAGDALKGQAYERNGDGVHDPSATESSLLHLVQGSEWSSLKKIRATFALCSEEIRTVAARAFAPRRLVGTGRHKDEHETVRAAFARYTGLLPYTRAVLVGYQRTVHRTVIKLDPAVEDLVDFLVETARDNGRRGLRKAIETEVLSGVRSVLIEYDGHLQARIHRERALAAARAYEIRGEADRRHRAARTVLEA